MQNKNVIKESSYWNNFYSNLIVNTPSQFCALLASEISVDTPVIEFGCGNGRDAIFLSSRGYKVRAIDLSEQAIAKNNLVVESLENISFFQGDVSVKDDVISQVNAMREESDSEFIVVYSRFFLHTLDDAQENSFLEALSSSLRKDDKLYFEFRSLEDANVEKIYGSHYRRYVDSAKLVTILSEKYGFQILYTITGQGMAKYKNEDPFVTRIIASKI